jgi:hypothetical protein
VLCDRSLGKSRAALRSTAEKNPQLSKILAVCQFTCPSLTATLSAYCGPCELRRASRVAMALRACLSQCKAAANCVWVSFASSAAELPSTKVRSFDHQHALFSSRSMTFTLTNSRWQANPTDIFVFAWWCRPCVLGCHSPY